MLSDSCPIGTAVKGHQQRYQNPTKKGGWNLPSGPQSAELQVAACNLQPATCNLIRPRRRFSRAVFHAGGDNGGPERSAREPG